MTDGMSEAFAKKPKRVKKKINKFVSLVIDNDVVFIENTIGGPQLTDQIYLKLDTFEEIVKVVKKAKKNGSK